VKFAIQSDEKMRAIFERIIGFGQPSRWWATTTNWLLGSSEVYT